MNDLVLINNENFFNSDSIEHGRLVKSFFYELAEGVFKKNLNACSTYNNLFPEENFVPLARNEQILNVLFGSAISDITPMFMSECPFDKSLLNKESKNTRRVDYWCLNRRGDTGKIINYFIELKKSYYCTSVGTMEDINTITSRRLEDLFDQISDIKNINPEWPGDGNAYLGIMVVHGYRNGNRNRNRNSNSKSNYDSNHLARKLIDKVGGRKGIQMLMTTWEIPENHNARNPWDNNDICEFISIACFALSKKK